jgi:NUMOD3 motif-containing protein
MIDWKTGDHYIGATTRYVGRRQGHETELRTGRHRYFKQFESAFKEQRLVFFILQQYPATTTIKELEVYEQEWANSFPQRVNYYKLVDRIGQKQSSIHVANALRNRLGKTGHKQSLETKAKISKTKKGKKLSKETRINMVLAHSRSEHRRSDHTRWDEWYERKISA